MTQLGHTGLCEKLSTKTPLSLCPSPWTALQPDTCAHGDWAQPGWTSPQVSMRFLRMVKQRYSLLRSEEIHHFTKRLSMQVPVLTAPALTESLASASGGKEYLLVTHFSFRKVTLYQYK